MKKVFFTTLTLFLFVLFCTETAAFWIWTPKDKKLVYPKHAPKDSPEEHFKWAMGFFKEKDYKRAAEEFDRLAAHFKDSDMAPEAQYYAGRSYEAMGKYYPAFIAYQKTIDAYPFTKRNEEIVEKEYNLGNLLYKKHKGVLMGKEIMTDLDRAAEIFRKAKENAPFGEYGDQAQFMVGECYKKSEQYNEAMKEFQKLIDEYPRSRLRDKARYEVAQCTYLASLKPDYDQELTDEAIKEFRRIAETREGLTISEEAQKRISMLEEKKAQSLFNTAKFYERQAHHKSAAIYYEEIVNKYPLSSCAESAREKLGLMEERMETKPKKEKPEKAKPRKPFFSFMRPKEPKPKEAKIKPAPPEEPKAKPFGIFGYAAGSSLPAAECSIYVDNFVNKINVTEEITDRKVYYAYRPGMEADITRRIINRFIFDGNYEIKNARGAYFILKGQLINFKREPLRYDADDKVLEYRLSVVVDIELYKTKDKELVWRENHFAGESTYRTTGQFAKSESAAAQAAMNDLAERVVERTVESW
ncbi:MAG: LPS assembly lipoprotein LptE [Candidatus Omnitrophota bacterium]